MLDAISRLKQSMLMVLLCTDLVTVEISADLDRHRDVGILPKHGYLPPTYNKSLETTHHRIAGGYIIKEGEFPSFVSLRGYDGNNRTGCSGVAVSDRLILTAAHCFKDYHKITAAATIWAQELWRSKGVKEYEVDKICGKPKFGTDKNGAPIYDYKVLRLKGPIPGIKYACLPNKEVPLGYRGIIVGVGMWSYSKNSSIWAKSAKALPVERINCGYFEHPSRFCFKSYRSDYVGSICYGDSGGPVYGKAVGGEDVVLGITSFFSPENGEGPSCREGLSVLSGSADTWSETQTIFDLSRRCLRR